MNFSKISPSASIEFTRLANELRKQGKKVYPLSIGDTHFPPPVAITSRLTNLPSAWSHYTASDGIPELRTMIASLYEGYQPEEVSVVPGLKQGLYYLLLAFDGTRIAVPEPAWLGYQATAAMTNKIYVPVNRYQGDWISGLNSLDFDMLITGSPNNPDGFIFTEQEADRIMEICVNKNALIVLDEIYQAYQYDGDGHPFRKWMGHPLMIVGNGFSKSHAMTGFRIGYILLKNEQIRKRISMLQQNIITCPPAVAQYLALGAIDALAEVDVFRNYYRENRDLVLRSLPWHQGEYPGGGFYLFTDLRQFGIEDANVFCLNLLQESHIALVPGSAYGTGFNSFVRISFSLDREELAQALDILNGYIKQLRA
jgi:aspartate/methionine/tyrosine aminotransferase